MQSSGFPCIHCGKFVPDNLEMGTKNRNHCPYCLYSKHVDEKVGDRKAYCLGAMYPIGLTFKKILRQAQDKGELMLVHKCEKCGKISINRIAADDDAKKIMKVFKNSLQMKLQQPDIQLATEKDKEEVEVQLFGK